MKLKVVKIGNSMCIRLPKNIVDEYGDDGHIELSFGSSVDYDRITEIVERALRDAIR